MNIHCSACGAPLPQGAKFCPACALPLTAIAMPTPAPVKRPAPLWPWFVGALVVFIIACNIAAQLDRPREAAAEAARRPVPVVLTPEQIKKDAAIDAYWERKIDAEIWNHPEQIKNRITLLGLGDKTPEKQLAIARLQHRLKELHAQ